MTSVLADVEQIAPAYVYRPPRARSMAGQLEQLAERLGRPLFAEQVTALDVLTGLRVDGRAASRMAAIICGRQNMKTWDMQLIALGRLLMPGGDRYSVWSAHEVATSQETFRDFLELIEHRDHAWLRRYVVRVGQANGKEVIEFRDKRRLRFRARRRTGGRGLTGDSLFLDEGFALLASHMGAMLPILSTRSRAAVFVGSSAGLAESAVLRGIRDRGRAGKPGAPAYVEWCAPGSLAEPGCDREGCDHLIGADGCVLDRPDLVVLANPAVRVGRISVEALASERQELVPAEYARERFGWWSEPAGDTVPPITVEAWQPLAREFPPRDELDRPAFGIHVSPGSAWSAIVLAAWHGQVPYLEVVDYRRGTDWLPERVKDLRGRNDGARWLVEAAGAVGAVLPDIKAVAGLEPQALTPREMGQACVALQTAVADGQIEHDGSQAMTIALAGAAKRDAGEGLWMWAQRRSSTDIAPLPAGSIALLGLLKAPRSAPNVYSF